MRTVPAYLVILICLTTDCVKESAITIHSPPCDQVYGIIQHNDSLYVSTRRNGIFRMHPEDPLSFLPVAAYRNAPFRSFVFMADRSILAGSYEMGAVIFRKYA